MQKGDKLYCKKEYYRHRNSGITRFVVGQWYEIDDIYEVRNMNRFVITMSDENSMSNKFLSNNIYFANNKEVRKMKLKELNESRRQISL